MATICDDGGSWGRGIGWRSNRDLIMPGYILRYKRAVYYMEKAILHVSKGFYKKLAVLKRVERVRSEVELVQ